LRRRRRRALLLLEVVVDALHHRERLGVLQIVLGERPPQRDTTALYSDKR